MRSPLMFGGLLAASLVLIPSCTEEPVGPGGSDGIDTGVQRPPLDVELARAVFGQEHPFPEAVVPSSPELIALGRDLYHDEALSTQGNQSCASCHNLETYGQDGQKTSMGSEGERGERNSPTSINAFRQLHQFWDGRAATVEEQAQGPVVNPIEHGFGSAAEFEAALKKNPEYIERFASLFDGDGAAAVTIQNFGAAVGAFERTLETRSRFDEFVDGDDGALTADEKAGLALFMSKSCNSCHNGRVLGGAQFRKLGEVIPYDTDDYTVTDVGRGGVTGNEYENYQFKVPMLLNVAETAPYFHDGSVPTLEVAVKRMAQHQLGQDLSKQEIDWIVAFLGSLTGELQTGD